MPKSGPTVTYIGCWAERLFHKGNIAGLHHHYLDVVSDLDRFALLGLEREIKGQACLSIAFYELYYRFRRRERRF